MRIGIDARMLGPQQGGLGRYVEELIRHLEKLDRQNEYVVFLNTHNWQNYTPTAPNFHKILADIPWYGWAEQLRLPRLARAQKLDLMHFPHWNVPLFYRDPFVVTVHDLIPLHHPSHQASTRGILTYAFKYLFFRLVLWHAAGASRAILTVSKYSRADIARTLKISLDKITVTYPAPREKINVPSITTDILNKQGIHKPYLLYVGVAYPHKNLENLLRAWRIFQTEKPEYTLVLAGKKNYFYERLENFVKKEKIPGVIFTGFVEEKDLPALYAQASMYVFPSWREGFGLPPLEAMQYGLPVASAHTSCLPEVLQDGALYFDPREPDTWVKVWREILFNQSVRTKLIQAGEKIIHSYSWENTARLTWEVYKKVV